ncbi:DUF3016 domain-containing protein [Terrihabitans rhizophilus]|uniref:DUF3016 domain-containing protein n=1 Tax=Terrihabitans rhizophilus TaxID=3092662 RepID=A0ABU4RQA6_9HYPH|nr:DUF3016 domain-containing protein [Terrihabitans sp. PJ23]MDX6806373.1 DUF3016 domain-containing protein [Terrihabitans sp. PJ23]
MPAAIIAVSLAAGSLARADVRVVFENPRGYTDASSFRRGGVEPGAGVLRELERYLQRLGERNLGPTQRLDIRISDVDLAGGFRPSAGALDQVRIVDGLEPPRITLSYELHERGRRVASGRERLADINFQWRSHASGRLGYEKALLRDWFEDRIVKRRPARRPG